MNTAAGVVVTERRTLFQQHRAAIQPGLHLHYADAGFLVARLDSTLDRRRATPAWQQRTVDIDTAITGNIEYRLRDQQAVSHHHHHVRLQRRELGTDGITLEGFRLQYGSVVLDGELFDRRRRQLLATPGGAIRLGQHRQQLVLAVEQGTQRGGGEIGGTGKEKLPARSRLSPSPAAHLPR